jgi:hypothetical protein
MYPEPESLIKLSSKETVQQVIGSGTGVQQGGTGNTYIKCIAINIPPTM